MGFLINQPLGAVGHGQVVDQQHTAQARGKRLAPLSRQEGEGPERAAKTTIDLRAERVAAIFNKGDSLGAGPPLRLRHVAGNAIGMLHDDRGNLAPGDVFQPPRVDIVRVGIDVDIGRFQAGELHGRGNDHASVAGHEHRGAARQAEGPQTDVESHSSFGQEKTTAAAKKGFDLAAKRLRLMVAHDVGLVGDGNGLHAALGDILAEKEEIHHSPHRAASIGEVEHHEHQRQPQTASHAMAEGGQR